ncbi:MAG: hypothetical protein IJ583_04190, partial [Firmicutes bacterium]|nr:hypothetical protein [Bacillota bacterium]
PFTMTPAANTSEDNTERDNTRAINFFIVIFNSRDLINFEKDRITVNVIFYVVYYTIILYFP